MEEVAFIVEVVVVGRIKADCGDKDITMEFMELKDPESVSINGTNEEELGSNPNNNSVA